MIQHIYKLKIKNMINSIHVEKAFEKFKIHLIQIPIISTTVGKNPL